MTPFDVVLAFSCAFVFTLIYLALTVAFSFGRCASDIMQVYFVRFDGR